MSERQPVDNDGSFGGTVGFLSGLLIGGLLGATIAMILAPQPGEDTRDVLRAKAREASGRVRDAAEDLSGGMTASAGDLLSRGKHIVEEARARLDSAVIEGKDAAAEQRSTLEKET
ncbi:MAG: YtxH domain-containing protein [Candidatus Velthaea sp.]